MNKDFIKYHNFKKYLTCQPFFIWKNLNTDILKNEDINEKFWSSDFIELISSSIGAIIAKTFNKIDDWLIDYLTSKYKCKIIKGNIEEKIKKTQKLLNSQKILINPVFQYKEAIASPFAFNSKTNEIINIHYSKKTKRSNFIKAYYDYSIINKNIDVKDYWLFLPKNKNYLKNEIDLEKTNKCYTQISGFIPGEIDKNGKRKDVPFLNNLKLGKIKNIFFPQIETAIKAINQSRKVKKIENDFIYDVTKFGFNSEWDKLLEIKKCKYFGVNGNIFKKKEIAINVITHSTVWEKYLSINESVITNKKKLEKIFNQIKKSHRVIWYDFEGFSLPFAPLDNVGPYQQLVFQVSMIETIDNIEHNKINFVIDPKKINLDNLFNIIKIVYQNKANAYVVYNKSYENARIKEIVDLLERKQHTKAKVAKRMYQHIIDNTIDLYELFRISSKSKMPCILMHDQKCKASIKNIEKHINENHINLPRPIRSYNSLDIQNGGMAMNAAIERSLNIIGNIQWKQTIKKLEKYCENDVRAMIMVYDFVEYLINK